MAETKQYLLTPRKGFLSEALKELHPLEESIGPPRPFMVKKTNLAGGKEIRVIHSILPQGPKVVELDDEAARAVDQNRAVLRWPIFKYDRPLNMPLTPRRPSGVSGGLAKASAPMAGVMRPKRPKGKCSDVTIKVWGKENGKRVPIGSGLLVTAISNYKSNEGDEKVTDASGEVMMRLSGQSIEQLYCEQLWRWGAFRRNIPISPSIDLDLEPLNLYFRDGVRQYYRQSRFDPSIGVTVGVIDTGVGPHLDLHLIGGRNVVLGQSSGNYYDSVGHGTFVAGLIGAQGTLCGLAPGVGIRSYRIFGGGNANSADLLNAIGLAQIEKCDIINLSIENGDPNDQALKMAITDARDNGVLVVVAAGNDFRGAVNYPAAFPGATAVSAMGREGTFPPGVIDEAFVDRPPKGTTDPDEFLAGFSNVGKQISLTGLGVGVLSTLPGNGFGSCSGTSMAAPVVSGAAACLLSGNKNIYEMPRDRNRSLAIENLLKSSCLKRGFGSKFEGWGMPDPATVCY